MNGRRKLKHLFIHLTAGLLCAVSVSASADTLHEVGKGETLASIASYYKMTVTDIINANGLHITEIYQGQLLKIPYDPSRVYTNPRYPNYQNPYGNNGYQQNPQYTQPTQGSSYPNYGQPSYGQPNYNQPNYNQRPSYNQQPNYAQPSYGRPSNSTANAKAILGANGQNPRLKPLSNYPNKGSSSTKPPKAYQVRSGDSLSLISKRYNITINSIAKLNGISPNSRIYVGQMLKLPDVGQSMQKPSSSTTVKRPTSRPNTRPAKSLKYRVKNGDTLTGIASRYGMSVNELASANNMSRFYRLRLGQTLVVPGKNTVIKRPQTLPSKHKVQYGEGLISIAQRYNVSRAALAQVNGLTPNSRLIVGQVLKLPSTRVTKSTTQRVPTQHRVTSGEGLITIANKYKVNQLELARVNGLQPYASLYIGQVLKLPANAQAPSGSRKYAPNTY